MKQRLHNCAWAVRKRSGLPKVLALEQHFNAVHHKTRFKCPFPGCDEECGKILPLSYHVWKKNLHRKKK